MCVSCPQYCTSCSATQCYNYNCVNGFTIMAGNLGC